MGWVLAFVIGTISAGTLVFLYSRRQIQSLWEQNARELQTLKTELQLLTSALFSKDL